MFDDAMGKSFGKYELTQGHHALLYLNINNPLQKVRALSQ